MKQQLTASVKRIFEDRYLATLLLAFILLSLGVIVYLLLSIHPSELQVVIHYTVFGPTNFYRNKWYYLLAFIAFITLAAIMHTIMAYKLLTLKGRQFANAFLWLGIVVIVITTTLVSQLMKVASLS